MMVYSNRFRELMATIARKTVCSLTGVNELQVLVHNMYDIRFFDMYNNSFDGTWVVVMFGTQTWPIMIVHTEDGYHVEMPVSGLASEHPYTLLFNDDGSINNE